MDRFSDGASLSLVPWRFRSVSHRLARPLLARRRCLVRRARARLQHHNRLRQAHRSSVRSLQVKVCLELRLRQVLIIHSARCRHQTPQTPWEPNRVVCLVGRRQALAVRPVVFLVHSRRRMVGCRRISLSRVVSLGRSLSLSRALVCLDHSLSRVVCLARNLSKVLAPLDRSPSRVVCLDRSLSKALAPLDRSLRRAVCLDRSLSRVVFLDRQPSQLHSRHLPHRQRPPCKIKNLARRCTHSWSALLPAGTRPT